MRAATPTRSHGRPGRATGPAALARLARLARVALPALVAGCAGGANPDAAPPDSAAAAATAATTIQPTTDPAQLAFLDTLQERTFRWFWETTDARTGLTPDRWPTQDFASVASIGFALTAYPVGVERGWVTRDEAATRTLNTLRFLWQAPQGADSAGMAGHKGFFYHFLDERGRRFREVELSTIDTALLLGGVLFAQMYFGDTARADEGEIRALADSLYHRVDWRWAQDDPKPLVSMGWRPERGFIESDWRGYNEAMLLYVLALGSPTHAVEPDVWEAWTSTYEWGEFQGQPHLNFTPLFGHQYSHVWIDFRGIQDAYMRERGAAAGGVAMDYFENSRRATLSQRAYAIANPGGWRDYGPDVWGLTASDGPTDTTVVIDGRERRFHSYWARGASLDHVNDDGTIVPTAAGGSIPFAPEITIPALMHMRATYGDDLFGRYGFLDAFNPTFRLDGLRVGAGLRHGKVVPGRGWFDTDYLGIDQGPILLMAENHRTGLVWEHMRRHPAIVRGLRRAGFTGGWLDTTGTTR